MLVMMALMAMAVVVVADVAVEATVAERGSDNTALVPPAASFCTLPAAAPSAGTSPASVETAGAGSRGAVYAGVRWMRRATLPFA